MAKKKQTDAEKYSDLTLEDALKAVNKKYGAATIARASTARALSVPRLETGVFAVDFATGGGLPIGRITGIFGDKSSGKSLLAFKAVASAQRYCRKHLVKMKHTKKKLYRCLECGYLGDKESSLCPDCKEAGYESKLFPMGDLEMKCPVCKEYNPFKTIWFDAEGAFENHWAAQMGVNCHHVYTLRTEYAEQAIDISDVILRSGKCDLLVIDTLAHLIPSKEIEESSENWQMGLQARLINKMLRKLVSAQNVPNLKSDTRPTIILINQIRMKLGVMFGDPTTRPGGMGQEFATSLDIKMWPGKYEKDEDGNTLNLITNFRCTKNKVSPPQQQGNFRIWLREWDGHRVGDNEDKGVVIGQAFKHGWFGDAKKGWQFEGVTFKRKMDVTNHFVSNPDAYEELRTGLFADMLGTIASDKDALKIADTEEAVVEEIDDDEEVSTEEE